MLSVDRFDIVFIFILMLRLSLILYSFFFQAEDGIRDGHVTGVQTCALPIFPAHEVAAVDTTGAGDAFVGAMALRLSEGAVLVEAVELATSVAAVAVSRRGAQESFPTLDELGGPPAART